MKIVTVVDSIPPVSGGAQRVAWDLSLNLMQRGHECHIVTFSDNNKNLEKDGLFLHKIREPSHTHRHFLFGKGQRQIYRILD